MSRHDIFRVLKANILDLVASTNDSDIAETHTLSEVGADSLESIEVISRTISQLKVRLPRGAGTKAKNIQELLDLLENAANGIAA